MLPALLVREKHGGDVAQRESACLASRRSAVRARSSPPCSLKTAQGWQASKGVRWMPWRRGPMKDVASCDKPRGAASGRKHPGISEWGNLAEANLRHPVLNP